MIFNYLKERILGRVLMNDDTQIQYLEYYATQHLVEVP